MREWKRVRIYRWTPTRDVQVQTILRNPSRFKPPRHQLLDNLIGVSVPVETTGGVVVMPLSYLSGGTNREYVDCDCTNRYYIVPEEHLEILGDAYDEEIRVAERGLRAHNLSAVDEDTLRLRRLAETVNQHTLKELLVQFAECDVEKQRRNRRVRK